MSLIFFDNAKVLASHCKCHHSMALPHMQDTCLANQCANDPLRGAFGHLSCSQAKQNGGNIKKA